MAEYQTTRIDRIAPFILAARANEVRKDPHQLLTEAEAAAFLGCSRSWLEKKRKPGATPPGPAHVHPYGDRRIRYRRGTLIDYVLARDAAYRAQLGEAEE